MSRRGRWTIGGAPSRLHRRENHEGERIGVIARRSGEFELVVYSAADPDTSQLNREEADTLAEILGAPRIAERFTCLPEAKKSSPVGCVSQQGTRRLPSHTTARIAASKFLTCSSAS